MIDSGTKIHDARFAVQLLPFNSGLVGGANFWPWFLSHINFSGEGRESDESESQSRTGSHDWIAFHFHPITELNTHKLCYSTKSERATSTASHTGTLLHQ